MEPLQQYVETLFAHERSTPETEELKEEILANMIAKKNDLMQSGLSEAEAIARVKKDLPSISGLVTEEQCVDLRKYRMLCARAALLCATLFWIFSMPLALIGYRAPSLLGLCATLAAIVGDGFCRRAPESTGYRSLSRVQHERRIVWLLWGALYLVLSLAIAAISFGSALWFGRGITIAGPYAFAQLAARFYLPLLTIFIPLAVGSRVSCLSQSFRGDQNEK